MSDQEILEKAIQKAIDGGWKKFELYGAGDAAKEAIMSGTESGIIFDHAFAKALWGADETRHEPLEVDAHLRLWTPTWQHRLQLMVVADDPIKYLGENL